MFAALYAPEEVCVCSDFHEMSVYNNVYVWLHVSHARNAVYLELGAEAPKGCRILGYDEQACGRDVDDHMYQ